MIAAGRYGGTLDRIRRLVARQLERAMTRHGDAFDAEALAADAVVFAPHSDDETLGCGGTIARKTAAGATVRLVFLTDGAKSNPAIGPKELAETRKNEAIRAASTLGVAPSELVFLDFPDGELRAHVPEAAARIGEILVGSRARQFFVPFREDGHPDHRAAFSAVMRTVRSTRIEVEVFEYPVWAWRHWPWVRLRRPNREKVPWRASGRYLFGLRFAWSFRTTSDVRLTTTTKAAALAEYHSQFEGAAALGARSLAAVSRGDFIERFRQPFEVFRRTRIRPGR